jgi:DNA processing protein
VWGDKEYPPLLRNISDPPLGLSIRGELSLLYRPAISVVGSRKASAFAMRESFTLGRALGEHDIAVVSGGALGCDIAAHHGVLASGRDPAPAICVFAGGLARLYPVANDPIFRRLMARRAVLVSERLWASPCRPLDFTARNRIISGMSSLTLVMQAAQRSGALVTARRALDQGSEVAVLRHPEGDIRARGSEALLAEGAWGFSCASELIEHANLSEASLASRTDSALQ